MSNEMTTRATAPAPTTIGQATAVEQARAVAEVQAAVTVAQSVPRDVSAAIANMQDACGRTLMAQRAFYDMPRAGGRVSGPTVHLARELARVWGNVQYGVHELRRDDARGESEIQAFAWDVQTNVRSTRTFVVPHARMARKERQSLTDLGDIYLNNQNVGARAVRECIFTVLPTWFSEEAQAICHRTIKEGDGTPLPERITAMLAAFKDLGVSQKMLEARLGRPRAKWQPEDLAQAIVLHTSISREGQRVEDVFEAGGQSVENLTPVEAASAPARPVTSTPSTPEPAGGWDADDQGALPVEGQS